MPSSLKPPSSARTSVSRSRGLLTPPWNQPCSPTPRASAAHWSALPRMWLHTPFE
ncbi:hypothetical protein [Variovorax sp.]|uniref:hypothetical protein n=1 Tax=Variovorax sp. TaxID=1871043 RepID=UPI00260135D6|nr:hypothetical protein [Variovorax sp.]